MAYNTNQIYGLVNAVAKQVMGSSAIQALNTEQLVSMGNTILNSREYTESFLNILPSRIGKTIIATRKYNNQLGDLALGDMEYGAVVQKINFTMPDAIADKTFELVDGQSVDQYVVFKPKVNQKLFIKRTPYSVPITIQKVTLKEAFASAEAMARFIEGIKITVRNYLELTLETLGRLAIGNYIAQTDNKQIVHIVTQYNQETGKSITTEQAWHNADVLRFAISLINEYSDNLKTFSTLYNKEGAQRHTPIKDQKYVVLSKFTRRLETVVQYAAFNERFVNKASNITVPFWQNANEPTKINLTIEDDNAESGTRTVSYDNIVGFIFDKYALGTYRRDDEAETTPIKARARY